MMSEDTGPEPQGRYLHGHAEPVLRSHRWRTADNSAAYLMPHLAEGQEILDVGCGPATITMDLGRRFPGSTIMGIDPSAEVLAGVTDLPGNVTLTQGDIFHQTFPDDRFDVVHAHQVLQHLGDPVGALRQMRRVCRPGGIVAVRDADYGAMTWAPSSPQLTQWQQTYRAAARAGGHDPDAGRHLLGWVQSADFTDITATAGVWCFSTVADRAWWAGLWADRVSAPESRLHQTLRRDGMDDDALQDMARAWHEWALAPDGWFAVLHGQIIARA
ncbi:MAG: methyltransferase domain-containing protein [Euzebya sp.]